MTRAVVFAYHQVGVRCLKVLLARGVEVGLVVTHEDNPAETIWFDSVAATAREAGLAVITPADPNTDEVLAAVRAARPDFLFSFYYRHMLKAPLLAAAARGAFNLHGSLLPKYRGRVPVNWAIIRGETETGASLHVMNVKPDNGPVVDQLAVPILPDDNAREVFGKVTLAAEIVLWRSLPGLIEGTAVLHEQDLSQGAYFGGRKPEDGRIDPRASAKAIHDFVRALSQPYPGAFADLESHRLVVWRTQRLGAGSASAAVAQLRVESGQLLITAADGGRLCVLEAELDGDRFDADRFTTLFGDRVITLA